MGMGGVRPSGEVPPSFSSASSVEGITKVKAGNVQERGGWRRRGPH